MSSRANGVPLYPCLGVLDTVAHPPIYLIGFLPKE